MPNANNRYPLAERAQPTIEASKVKLGSVRACHRAQPPRGPGGGRRRILLRLGTKEMGAGIAASPHCAERRICRCSIYLGSRPGKPVCDPASRSWLTSSGVASYRATPSCEEPVLPTRLRGPKVRWSFDRSGPASGTQGPSKPKPLSFPRPFLGRPLFASRFAFPHRSASSRVALEEDRLFRRLIPAGSNRNPKVLIIACRRRSDLWSPAVSCPRCRFLEEAGTAVPITCSQCTALPSRESEKFAFRAVDNGDIGQNRSNLPRLVDPALFGCRSVPLRLLRSRA